MLPAFPRCSRERAPCAEALVRDTCEKTKRGRHVCTYPRIRILLGILGYAPRLKGLVRDLVSEKEGIHSARLDFLPVRYVEGDRLPPSLLSSETAWYDDRLLP